MREWFHSTPTERLEHIAGSLNHSTQRNASSSGRALWLRVQVFLGFLQKSTVNVGGQIFSLQDCGHPFCVSHGNGIWCFQMVVGE